MLSAIWRRIQDSGNAGCNENTFREAAFETWLLSAYEDMMNLDDFMVREYDDSDYRFKIRYAGEIMHPDDIIDYCEIEISSFLEDDICRQYEDYALSELRWQAEDPEWVTESQLENLELDRDYLWIDQAIYKHVEQMVDTAISDLVPEHVYDEYAGGNRERRYDMRMDRLYESGDEEACKKKEMRRKIEELFGTLIQ